MPFQRRDKNTQYHVYIYIYIYVGTIGRKILRHRSYPTNATVLTQRQYNIQKKNHLNEKLQSDSQSVGAILKRRYIFYF